MKKTLLALTIAATTSGCAGTIKQDFAISGQMDDGTALAGEASAKADFSLNGFSNASGTFWVAAPGKIRCSGQYDPLDRSKALIVPVSCVDGRTGEAVITRTADLLSGSAIARLNDGTTAQFVFGDITYQQAFGNGGSASTNSVQTVRLAR